MTRSDMHDVNLFFEKGMAEVQRKMRQLGEEAIQYAEQNGTYHNVTGRLRSSNKYVVSGLDMLLYNDAPYARDVEARGEDVLSGAALYLEQRLREEFG